MNAIVTTGRQVSAQPPAAGGNSLMPQNMDQAMRLADMMARAKMGPSHFHNSPGDCLMVIEQAMRWNMSPFAVAQCASNVKGKLMFEGKIVAAAVENSGAIDGYIDYQFSGSGVNRKITVTATRRGESAPKTVEVELKDAITDNLWWKKTPDQMLVYHGARVWARRWTPAVMLGVYSPDEFNSTDHVAQTIELQSEPTPLPAAAQIEAPAPKRRTISEWLDELADALAAAVDAPAVATVLAHYNVEAAQRSMKNGALTRLNELVSSAMHRTSEPEPQQAPTLGNAGGGDIDDQIPF